MALDRLALDPAMGTSCRHGLESKAEFHVLVITSSFPASQAAAYAERPTLFDWFPTAGAQAEAVPLPLAGCRASVFVALGDAGVFTRNAPQVPGRAFVLQLRAPVRVDSEGQAEMLVGSLP